MNLLCNKDSNNIITYLIKSERHDEIDIYSPICSIKVKIKYSFYIFEFLLGYKVLNYILMIIYKAIAIIYSFIYYYIQV